MLVEDIATSPLWEDLLWLPLPSAVKGCWSVPIKLKSGTVAGTFAFYFNERGGPSPWLEGIVAACSDLCALALERHEAKSRIARLASIDTLTGLPNRSQLIEALSEAIAEACRLDQPLAVLFLDLDHFKDVNDTLGHSTGDQILVEMARRLKVQLRAGDIVGRTGGDEFVVLIHDCAADEAARICRRLLEYLAAPIAAQELHLTMSVSIGVALCSEHGTDAESLLKHADTAMHEAKRKGPGKFHFFTEDLNRKVLDRLVLSVALRDAITNRQLRHVYQPQVLLGDGALHGVEALSRWKDPVHGEVPAPRFIALAEEYGLIEGIDRWGVEEACRQVARWRAEGVAVPHVSVNLSPLSFRSGEIVGVISEALATHGLVPQDLRVEITERVMMDQHPNSLATARAIEALGVRIAMDDFGTGYSSLSALSRLPIAELKLDRSFMLSIEQDQNAQALSTAVIRIGHSLGMTVVAEGVETARQAALLRSLGCHAAQGYYFARPLAAEDLAGWLAAPPAPVPELLPDPSGDA
ncbi:putative bifunctional diguanylate cyclase/phosphodiesterase [Xanthobacter sp. AM11]|uniref:putative bifunctional diguanylate cyclase/phosphodiesterase n=1 Tax=Xanthobacter sp. AM11 TaxID=3380643 RepID=UPI0039BFACD3